jgi:hypothetical protein
MEEEQRRTKLGYSKLSDQTFENLKHSVALRKDLIYTLNYEERDILESKTIFNLYSYDLLANKKYQEMFQYTPQYF